MAGEITDVLAAVMCQFAGHVQSWECLARVCPTRNVPLQCLIKALTLRKECLNRLPQECSTKVPCRLCHKSFPQDSSAQKTACSAGVSHKVCVTCVCVCTRHKRVLLKSAAGVSQKIPKMCLPRIVKSVLQWHRLS